MTDGEREAVQARAQLARDRTGDAAHLLVGRRGQEHDDVAGGVGKRSTTAASEPGALERAARSAAASTRARQSSSAGA